MYDSNGGISSGTSTYNSGSQKSSKKKWIIIICVVLVLVIGIVAAVLLLGDNNSNDPEPEPVVVPDYAWNCTLLDDDGAVYDQVRFSFVQGEMFIQKGIVKVTARYDFSTNDLIYGFIDEYDNEDTMRDLFDYLPRILIINREGTNIQLRWEDSATSDNSPNKAPNSYCEQMSYSGMELNGE